MLRAMPDHALPLPSPAITDAGGALHWVDRPGSVRLRAAHWPHLHEASGRGTVLLLNGRTEFMERWHETVADLRHRGFAVWSLDWRGQGGSSRLLPNGSVNHVPDFNDHLDDLDALLDHHILPQRTGRPQVAPGPLVLLGHSMGGHLGALALARRPELFTRAVLTAPMIGVRRPPGVPQPLLRGLVRLACLRPGLHGRYAPGTPRAPDLRRPVERSVLTSCAERHAVDQALQRGNPHLVTGGASWGWLRAAMDSIALLQRPATAARITMPVLLLLAGSDTLVDNAAARRWARRLPHGEVVELPGARHELLREHDRHRAQAWAAVDGFLGPVRG